MAGGTAGTSQGRGGLAAAGPGFQPGIGRELAAALEESAGVKPDIARAAFGCPALWQLAAERCRRQLGRAGRHQPDRRGQLGTGYTGHHHTVSTEGTGGLRDGERLPVRGKVWVRARRELPLAYGDYVRATGILTLPFEIDAFSYADYLARQGVFSVLANAHIQSLGSGYGNRLRAGLLEVRNAAKERIGRYLPEPEAGLLVGILLGDESGISEEVYEDFSQVGAAHIIAISGFNMTLLAGILSVFLERMGIGRWRLLWVLALWIVLYTLLVGASPSVMRAAVMSLFLVLGYAMERRVLLLTSLAAGVLILTIGNPTLLWDIGFQLSAGGVLGIGVFFGAQRWRAVLPLSDAGQDEPVSLRQEWRRFRRGGWRLLRSIFLVTLAASCSRFPSSPPISDMFLPGGCGSTCSSSRSRGSY